MGAEERVSMKWIAAVCDASNGKEYNLSIAADSEEAARRMVADKGLLLNTLIEKKELAPKPVVSVQPPKPQPVPTVYCAPSNPIDDAGKLVTSLRIGAIFLYLGAGFMVLVAIAASKDPNIQLGESPLSFAVKGITVAIFGLLVHGASCVITLLRVIAKK